mmetsp:Transcript_4771/g.9280  ORF Transcript_4771/g.9280 Transcript_4771/m.9280 type:complete len:429 (-) Transcript_4771:326-1612(-)|eukprot:CAMPEP_0178698996 /NCGR_PEP_ID=MMETSP0699-20121125/10833_1 /TAXON_ID=265572 /ORGANISM="Extubocellulus spinifer, Strain CCMP396" /LENGTH=428 /DNA_ID=CAMNT_0020345091 /DNA_START=308 /DNA_END=1594 /DNA_ORIENTATION=-
MHIFLNNRLLGGLAVLLLLGRLAVLLLHRLPPVEDVPTYHTVIIGAGAAGLSASYTLIHHGIPSSQIRILESSNQLGGRARKDTTFMAERNGGKAAYPLDVGGSFIQYPDAIRRIVGRNDVMATPEGTGLPIFVNYTYWDFFNDYMAPKEEDVVHYGCRVTEVDYSLERWNKVATTCSDGRKYLSDHVIATVPLPILKVGDISFQPPLPRSMTIDHPGHMWEGFKIFLEFDGSNTLTFADGLCIEDIVPDYVYDGGSSGSCETNEGENLFWDYSSVHWESKNGRTVMAGYILGDQSLPYIGMDDEEIVQAVLYLLDDKFNGKASQDYIPGRSLVINWSKDENTRGALSSWGYDKPKDKGGTGNPSGAQSIEDKVWIAGEAFPIDGENGWIDAGAFSGDDAAKQILLVREGIEINKWFWDRVGDDLERE